MGTPTQTKPKAVCGEVIRSGFEPETHSLEGCCSIQLSYRTARKKARKITAFFSIVQVISYFFCF